MKKIIYITFIFISFETSAQTITDAVSVFKMYLYLNNQNINSKELDSLKLKDDSYYKCFSEIVILKLDTLKITGDFDLIKSALSPKYDFFQLSEHSYKKKLDEKELELYWVFGDKICSIAINRETGKSYRLLGFDTNDFLTFLSDFREEYKKKQDKKLSINQFLKNYQVEKLNFNCLYKGLNNSDIDRKKYPCLVRVSDPIWIR